MTARSKRRIASALTFFLPLATFAQSVDLVSVDKSDRVLRLMAGDQVIREYPISLGANPRGHKVRQGDERTPEGRYILDWRNPQSHYFRSIHISYPNAVDRSRAAEAGYPPGGDIFIHGLPNGMESMGAALEGRDWTDGCIAVNDNDDMWEIWTLVENGTPIEIQP